MKNIFLVLLLAAGFTVSAQRFGTTKNADNTGRGLTYGYLAPVVSATTVIAPLYYNTTYSTPSLTLSPTYSLVSTNAKTADNVTFIVGASAATRTVTLAGKVVTSASTFTVGSGKQATIGFIYDGTNYVEKFRTIQP